MNNIREISHVFFLKKNLVSILAVAVMGISLFAFYSFSNKNNFVFEENLSNQSNIDEFNTRNYTEKNSTDAFKIRSNSAGYGGMDWETRDASMVAMTVEVDATSTGTTTSTSLTISHTTTTSNNRLMLVGISIRETGSTAVTSITYNGVNLTKLGSELSLGARIEIWSLVTPASGTNDLIVNLNNAGGGTTAGVMTFTGVDQTTPLGAFGSNSGDATNGSATINSEEDELVFGVIAVKDADQNLVPGGSQTEQWDLFTATEANGGGSTAPGAATSVNMTWTWSASTDWAIGGVSIKPSLTSAQYYDEFTTLVYDGSDGIIDWSSSPWVEVADGSLDPLTGAIAVRNSTRAYGGTGNTLKTSLGHGNSASGVYVYREVDLSTATSATLSYYLTHDLAGADDISLEISNNGGSSWTVLKNYTSSDPDPSNESFDISAYLASNTQIRFYQNTIGGAGAIWTDNVKVEYSTTTPDLSLNPTQDSYILSVRPDENQGASSVIIVSSSSVSNNGLLQFDLSGIPPGATITSATLTMERTSGTIDPSGETIEVRGLTESWVEGNQTTTAEACTDGVTWDERDCDATQSWSTAGGTYNGTVYASSSVTTGTNTWTVTSLVQEWVDGSLTNNGLLVKKQNSSSKVHGFSSRTGSTPPVLDINYFLPPTTISSQINNGSDDAEEEGATGTTPGAINLSSSDIELVTDTDSPTAGVQTVGLRFNGLNIPQGATITNAYMEFTAVSADSPMDNSSATSLTIEAEASDNAPSISTSGYYLSTLTPTANSVPWSPSSWTTGNDYSSPDLSTVVQDLVDRSGWDETNSSMLFLISGTGSRSSQAYETSSADAARLYITYTVTTPSSSTISSRVNSSNDDAEESAADGANPGYMYMTSSDLEMTEDLKAPAAKIQTVGLRFNGLNLPQGVTITNAYIDFVCQAADVENDNASATSLTIKAEASDNASAMATTDYYLSGLTGTAASTAWSPGAWTTGTTYSSPDISQVVQELVDRPGWVDTNSSLLLIISGTGSRTAYAYDGVPANAPILYVTYTGGTPSNNISSRVNSSSDDAEEVVSNGVMDLLSTDLELNFESTTEQIVGMRFNNITVPNGAIITNAYIEFEVDELDSGATSLTIVGHDTINSITFTSTAGDISSRGQTTNTVSWNSIPAWGVESEKKQTPDISTIIQEIVDLGGWVSGNSLSIFIEGSGERTAESYEGEPTNAPILYVTYSIPEICNNGIDDDGDGLIDCLDPDCGTGSNIIAGCITVNSTGDGADVNPGDGVCADSNCECTLRAAIEEANALAGRDTICFNIPGAGVHIISPGSTLPTITDTLFIDGTTEPDFSTTPVVRIDGNSLSGNIDAFTFSGTSDYSEIRSLMITRFPRHGLSFQNGADYMTVSGNWIGTDGSGATSMGNSNTGLYIQSAYNTIGGTGSYDQNVIVNNNNEGINVTGSGASNNTIIGNLIGLEPNGISGAGNGDVGIALLSSGGGSNTIGGTTTAERNIISMNFEGMEISCPNNIIQGNYFGTDTSGTLNFGQRSSDAVEIMTGGNNNTIGGIATGAGNLIAYTKSSRHGVSIEGGTGNAILGNNIHSNTGMGINLGTSGVTANDSGDGDSGANNLQNYPVLSTATGDQLQITITGTFNSANNTLYRIEFYASSASDATGYGEGERYLGTANVTTDGSGNATINAVINASVNNGEFISALSTDPSNNTSEFSATVVAAITLIEICNNSIDDDGDGLIDCADPDCSANDIDGDLVCDFIDLDDDNDGIPDSEEGCEITSNVSGTIGFGNDVTNTTYSLTGTNITYARSGANEAVVQGYDTGLNGHSIVFGTNTTADGSLVSTFSNPVAGVYFKLTDFDGLEEYTINVYDENNVLYDLTIEGVLSVGSNITQTGNQFVSTIAGDLDGANPANDNLISVIFFFPKKVSQISIEYIHPMQSVLFFIQPTFCVDDTDGDGVFDYLDLDSDNDGIYDVEEAGHGATYTNGIVTGAVGANGLLDGVETSAESGVINYTISDSETAPDGIYDFKELDADGDTCYDALEEGISDTDTDGLAGTGVPTVDANGLVTTITYAAPANNFWQNSSSGVCLAEVCNDGIDNDADGDIDCADTDCAPIVTLNLVDSTECVSSTTLALSGESPSGGTYSGLGVTAGNFDASVAGVGKHEITYSYTDGNGCTNTATDSMEVTALPTITLVSLTGPSTPGGSDGSIDITTSGGSGAYIFSWSSGPTSEDLSSISSGTYTITVTDIKGCQRVRIFEVTDAATNTLTGTVFEDFNANAILDGADTGPAGVTVRLYNDNNQDGLVDGGDTQIQTTATTAGGVYSFQIANNYSTSYDGQVTLGSDDARDGSNNDSNLGLSDKWIGVKFGGIDIPSGATITSAYLEFTSKGLKTLTPSSVNIRAQDTATPATFSNALTDVSSRTGTTANVNWTLGSWTKNLNYQSPDLATIIQELITSYGTYSSGEMAFIIEPTATWERDAYSYDGSSSEAPRLVINYTIPSTFYHVVDVDVSTLPVGATLTTDNIEVATFTASGQSDSDNDFGYKTTTLIADAGLDDAICIGDNTTLTASSSGGTAPITYSWDNGLGAGASKVVSPVTTTTYIVTATDDNGYIDTDTVVVTVNSLPVVTLSLIDSIECVSSTTLVLSGENPTGGTFSGTGVSGGNFDASIAGIGKHEITYNYTDGNGCINTATDSMEVTALPIVTLSLVDSTECVSSTTLVLSGENPTGGTFSGLGVSGGNFDASVAGVGKHELTYSYTDGNGCINTATDSMEVTALPIVTLDLVDSTECVNSTTLILSGENPSGGTFSGLGVSGGNFDASIAGVGKHEITYSYTDGNGCINTATDSMEVTALPIVTLDLVDSTECVNSTTLILSGESPSGGTFSGTGVSGGNFDASIAGVGKHEITYTYTEGLGCVNTATDTIEVFALPVVSFNLNDHEDCVNNTILTLGGGSPVGGIYSGTGVSGGNFNASSAGVGTHTITYTYTDSNGCVNSVTDDLTVFDLTPVTLTLPNNSACVTSTTLALSGGSPSGGTFSGPGVVGTNFDASVAGVGVHDIDYNYTDANGCTNTATSSVVVFALPIVTFTLPDDSDCIDNNTFTLSGGSPSGGTYSGTGVTGTNFDASTAGLGTHTITYTYTDGNGCTNSNTDDITVSALPIVSLTLGVNEDCENNTTLALSGGSPVGGTYSGTGVSGANFNASTAGVGTHSITYTYTDANGCTNTDTDDLRVYPVPSVTTVTSSDPTICGGLDGSISVTAAGGTGSLEYRLNTGSWQVSNIFAGLGEGSYNVQVRNDNGFCETSYASNPVILSDPTPFTAEIILPAAECQGEATSFTATDAGVGATYAWDFGVGATPATATGIGPHTVTYSTSGTKNIELTLTKLGCTDIDNENYTVYGLPVVSLTLPDDEECVSSTTLALSGESPTGGAPAGTFSGNGVTGTNFDASAAGVGVHTITFTYSDENGCINSATDDITVTALPVVSLTLATDEDCITGTTLVLSGGSPSGGTYSGTAVSGTNFDASTAGTGVHTITYTYTDGNGCVNTATDDITVYDFPNIDNINPTDPTTCSGSDGTITITASGGSGSFEYRLNSGSWQASNSFTGLSSGSYNVSVRNDNGLCELSYISNPVVLSDPPATVVTTAVFSNYTGEDISCVGESDGIATASGSGGTAPYTYIWSNGQTGDTLQNVVAGTYSVTVTDNNNCQGVGTITLNDPTPLGVNAIYTHVSCYGGSDGAIDVTATGGVGAYTYAWNDMNPEAFWAFDGNTDDITGNGHHAIYISGTEAYSNDAIDGNQSFHFDGNTRIRLDDDVSFLETPFNYRTVLMWIKPDALSGIQMLWDEGDKQNGIAFRLNNDKLQGTVAVGNQKRTAFELTFPNDGQWHEVGFVYDNGLFTLFLDGVPGTTTNTGFTTINMKSPPWNWNLSALGGIEWDDANGQWKDSYFSGLMDNVRFYETALNTVQVGDGYTDDGDRSGLPAGDYKVYVYDLNGCTDSITLTITQPDSLALTANLSDVLCNGESNGEIDLVVAGGTAPFTYIWSTGATIEDIAGLSTGTYTVTVTDDNGCTVEDDFTINEPTVLTATAAVTSNYSGYDISCFGVSDGNATASPVGGTSPYTYLWSNGQTNANLTNVTAGTYTVTATDDNGCSTTASVTLNNPPSIIVNTSVTSSYSGEDISCVGASDGIANAVASAGVGSYTYLWSNGQTGASLSSVSAGTYTVTATDDNGCTATGNITLDDPSPIVITTSVTSDYNGEDVSCPGDTDGSADASASGGIGSFTYLWSNGQTGVNLTGVGAGTYTVTATDAFSCTSTQTVTLVNPSTVGVTINKTSNYNAHNISCVGASDGNATATGSGGVSGYTYLWSNGQSTANLTNVKAGTYTVTTTDANGCTSVASVNFSNPPPLNISITSSDPSDCGIDDGIILVTTSGGVGTYEYSLDGVTYQSSNSFTGLGVGTYFVYVRNTYGTCVKGPTAVFINYPEAPTIDNITIINPTTGVSTDGGILVSASGNGLVIEYSLDGVSWQSSNLFSNLSVGTYNLEVRYTGLNCLTSSTVTLTAGGGVVGSGGGLESYCSDDLSGVNFVEVYYIPFPEDQVLSSLLTIAPASCGLSRVPVDPIQTYVSIGAVEDGTIIYFDHWEDGFETNLAFPVQSTTEVWGDGNASNGIPPGYTVDILNAASIIVLDNAVVSTTRAAVIDFDGGDKIASRGNLAITRLAWADETSTLLAGALEVYPTVSWGTNFEIPVGANTDVNNMFEYTGATIMAAQNNTIVNIDSDGDGTTDVTITLNEGESYMQNGGFFSGGSISTSAPVQVGLITGDNCVGFESRFFTLKPMDQWSDNYYNPVSTMSDGSNGTNNSNRPTYVHLYNPNSTSIDVYWDTDLGNQGFVSVPAKGTNFIELPEGTGSNFYTTDNSIFYAIATIDSDPDGSSRNSRNDWGFALMPESQITSQITLVGFAPGQDPTSCTTGAISKAAWNIQYVDSEETVAGTHPATNAIDDDNNTFWHSKWDGGSDPLPHEIQIDLGATHDINGFSYLPRQDIASPTTNLYASTDVPKTITTSGTPTITSTLTVAAGGMITDIDVINLDITHEEIKELTVTLTSPSGTSVVLLENPCDKDDDIYMSFDDEAASGSFPCPPTGGLTYQPFENLSDFDGEISTGTWTLTIEDNKNNKGGSLNGWSLNMETGTVSTDGNIADYEFYVSADGVSWGAPRTVGTWASGSSQQTETFPSVQGRYVRLVATSEVNGNPWTSIAELDVMECAGGAENSAPVWLTADFPSGSTYSGNITVCIDYNGDGGSITDANGVKYDATVVLTSLQNAKIYDPDGNQTGMRLWVCDGTDAVIAGAWGQDPATASPASPAIDLGVGLPNGIPFATSKCVDLSKDYNSDGLFNECDEVVYTIIIRNSGVLPLSVGALNIKDTLPADMTYIENTTTSIINGVVTNITDDSSPASAFPLDENGLNYSAVILPKDSIILRFEASINDLTSATFIRNVAHITNGSQELFPEVSFPALEPIGTILAGVPADTIVECSDVPSPPIIGTDIRAVNNCEEMDTIPQAGWSLYFVDSEDVTSGELAVNAFDGDPNTIWSTQWNGADPIHPHEIQIDLGATYTIGGFRYLPRQIGNNGRIRDFEIYVSSDGVSWGTAVATGTWTDVTSEQEEIFNLELGRYIRLVATSEVNGNPWTAVAEINILQCVNYAPVTIDFSETSTQTNDGSATDDCFDITRTWETNDHCGEISIYTQNITVTDIIDPVLVDVPEDITVTTQTIPDPPTLNCSTPGNLALGKPTTQSSTIVGGDASNAVDGNTDGDFSNGSVTQTNNEVQPWWEIDLQTVASIDSIEVWNRTDCCASNLSNYYVLISDVPFASTDLSTTLLDANVTSFFKGTTAGSPTKISIDTTARYIRIQLQGTAALSLTEVVVTQACVSATDNCDTDATVTFSEVTGAGTCTYDITRTWTATDNCGNTSSESQVITVSSILSITESITSDFNGRDISCVGASDGAAEVVVTGGVAPININWSNGQTTASAINLIAGTYTVTVSDGNGCTAEANVTLQDPPSFTVGANITSNHNGEDISCFGASDGSVFANASGGTGAITYAWSSGQNVASASGLSSGTYTVTATDNNGCTSSASVTLDDPAPLTLTASVTSDYNGEDISCPGASDGEATASPSGGSGTITYSWSDSQTGTIASTLSAGTYTVTATDGNGCIATAVVTLSDPTIITPSITTSTNPTLCEATDGSITLSASGGMGSYEYKNGVAGTWQAGNVFSSLSSGTFDFYVRNSDGTCEVGPISETLSGPIPQSCPIIVPADTLIYCNSDVSVSFKITTTPDATGYTWTAPVGTSIIFGQSTDSIVINMNDIAIGSYDVCVVTNSNCGDSPSCCITIELVSCIEDCSDGIDNDGDGLVDCDDPDCGFSADAGSDATICNGENTNLSASGGTSYAWSPSTGLSATNISNPIASPTTTTTYTVTVTDGNGCTATDAVIVNVNSLPTADAGSDATICDGSSTNLSASGGTSYVWSPSTGLSATNISNPIASPTTTTTYTVTVTDGNSCTSTDAVIVNVNSLPTADAGSDATICDGSSTNLSASGGTSYAWSPSTGLSATNIFNPIASPTTTTTYTVTVTDGNSCTSTDAVIVNVNSLPTADAGSDATICDGSSTNLSASGGTSYAWSPSTGLSATNISNPIASPTTTTTYTVTVTDGNGCTATDAVIVNVNSLPTADAGIDATICNGENTNLSASGGTSYAWSPSTGLSATNISNPIASPTTTTTYTVTVTDGNGCTATDAVIVNVNSLPTADAGSDATICDGSSTNLSASGGTSYAWSPSTGLSATNISNPIASPTTTTTYTVTVTDGNSCTSTDAVIVNVNSLPTADAGSDATICDGSSTNLSASGGTSYAWSPSTGLSATNISNPIASPTTTTTYTVTVTDGNSCTSTDAVIVNVNSLPTADAGSDATICDGSSTNLSASGGTSYAWSPSTGLSATNISNPIASPTTTTTYTVTVTDGNGCTATDAVIVNVNSLPTADAGSDATICDGLSTNLSASGGTSYAWSPSTGLSATNISNPIASPTTTTTYTVTVTDGNGCTATDAVIVNVNSLPTADAGIDATICDGSSTNLSASGGTSYAWSPSTGLSATNISNPIASPTTTTTYTVTVTDGNSCTSTDAVIVTVNSLPTADAGSDATICNGENTNLSASGGTSYAWSPSTGLSATNISNPIASPTTTTTYTVTVTDGNGCTATDAVIVNVNSLPTADAGSDATICDGSSTNLSASGGTSYAWSPSTGLSATNISNPIASPTTTTTYTVTVTDGNGCTATDAVIVNVNSLPTADAGIDATICNGENTNLSASGGTSYAWSPSTGLSATNISNPTASPTTTTTYTVTVTDGNGCTSTDAVIVNVNSLPTADAGSDATICDGSSTNLSASGGTSYAWSPSTGLSATNISNPIASPTTTTTYTVTVTDGNGCTSTDAVIVNVNSLPTADAGIDATICDGSSTNLSASGGTSYAWSPSTGLSATNISNPIASPTTTTTYTVTVTDGNSCTSTDAVIVNVNSLPTADAGSDATICNGENTNLSASGGTSYAWSPSTGLSATNISNPIASPTTTTTYTVTVTDGNSCTSTDAVIVNVNSLPTADAGIDATICNGENTNLSASGGTSYAWSPSTGLSATNISNPIASPTTTTTYTVTVTDGNSCTSTDAVIVNVNNLPSATITSNSPLCPGENLNLSVPASASYSWTGPNGFSSNQQSPIINSMSPTEAGLYSVTVTNGFGCTASDNINVTLLSCTENCTNGIDDDGDGLTDCDDPDCAPVANNATLNTCDNSNMTGSGTFFLHDANPTVSSESGVMISYHPTLLDAQNGTNILISPYTSADATVYARVERVSTGCFATSEITLDVGAKCAENCNNGKDEDGDGLIDCDDTDCPCCDAYAPTLNGLNKKDP